jgi:hypothetical protein
MEVTVDGQKTMPLTDEATAQRVHAIKHDQDVCWQLTQPVSTKLRISAKAGGIFPSFLGKIEKIGAHVYQLGDFDPKMLNSNLCEIEWPPKSGRKQLIPEADRAAMLKAFNEAEDRLRDPALLKAWRDDIQSRHDADTQGTAQAVSGRVAARQQAAMANTANARGASATPRMLTDEVMDQLKKLAELRDAGVLSEKEFAAKKAKLLP